MQTALILYGRPSLNPSESLWYFICSSSCSGECLERTPCYDLCWQHWCFVENPHSTPHKVWGTLFVLPRAWTWMGSLVRISSYSYLWAWPHTQKKETELTIALWNKSKLIFLPLKSFYSCLIKMSILFNLCVLILFCNQNVFTQRMEFYSVGSGFFVFLFLFVWWFFLPLQICWISV